MEEKFKLDCDGLVCGGELMHSDNSRKPDFSGYATKAGLKCSDGRVIMPDAFKHQDKTTVPLVWQHNYSEPTNILGHAILENREDGVYAYGYFNDSEPAKNARVLVQHGDIKSLSIYANQLTEKAKQVLHGFIRELSLVLSGANPGALIDNITLAHQDGNMVTLEDEAIIYTGLDLERETSDSKDDSKDDDKDVKHEDDGPSVQEVYDSMTDQQKEVVHYMIGVALEDKVKQSAISDTAVVHSDDSSKSTDDDKKDGLRMSRNVFEQQGGAKKEEHALTHDAIKGIVADAQKLGSLKEAVEAYALKHGINDIEILFPDAKAITATPEFDARRVEWVAGVINGTRHSPFSRIKSLSADLTFDEARAKGYIKGNLKKEEFFGVSKRITTPSTIYKKQKLDRDDIVDITDFDVVVWLKGEMRLMMDEELARAILIGDGRDVDDEDKIRDPAGATEGAGIRSILNDHELYVATANVNIGDSGSSQTEIVDAIVRAMRFYKGSGSPTLYTTLPRLTEMLLARDSFGHRLWKTPSELAAEMGVSSIVTVEVMEDETDLVGIIVNLKDYVVGADKGGEINFFDDFDIDYNQYKYLLETRVSGALTKIRSALVIRTTASGNVLVTPLAPAWNPDTFTVTVPTVTGVVYKDGEGVTLTTGAPVTLDPGETLNVIATPASGYYFESDQDDEWVYSRPT